MASEIGFKAGTIDIPREERETSLRKEESREAKKKGKGEIFPPYESFQHDERLFFLVGGDGV